MTAQTAASSFPAGVEGLLVQPPHPFQSLQQRGKPRGEEEKQEEPGRTGAAFVHKVLESAFPRRKGAAAASGEASFHQKGGATSEPSVADWGNCKENFPYPAPHPFLGLFCRRKILYYLANLVRERLFQVCYWIFLKNVFGGTREQEDCISPGRCFLFLFFLSEGLFILFLDLKKKKKKRK